MPRHRTEFALIYRNNLRSTTLPHGSSLLPEVSKQADPQAGETYIEGRFTNIGGGKFTTILTTLQPGETAPNWKPTDTPTRTAREAPAGT